MTRLDGLSEKVNELKNNQQTHMLTHAAHDGAQKQTGKIVSASKTFVITAVAIGNAIVAAVVAATSGGKP